MIKKLNERLKQNINKLVIIISFIIFLIILIWAVIFKFNIEDEFHFSKEELINYTLKERFNFQFTRPILESSKISTVILNSFVFLPLPLYLGCLFKNKNMIRDLLISLGVIIFIEIFQLFSALGCFEFFDILTNFIGVEIGALIFMFLKPKTSNLVINYINIGIIILFLPLGVYAIINTIIHFDYYKPFFDGTSLKRLFKVIIN